MKYFACLLSLLPLFCLLTGTLSLGSSIDLEWISFLSIRFHLVIDALSLPFLYLVACICPLCILLTDKPLFYLLILTLEALLLAFFTARDLALFTVFWEAMLLPLYVILNLEKEQGEALSLKFLLYMLAGSVLMVAALLSLYLTAGSFDMAKLAQIPVSPWVAFVFLLAFAVKTPLFPFHGWLPETYTQAPLVGTILLSALLSKAGIYGIARVGWEIFPHFLEQWGPPLTALAIFGTLYAALAAWRQTDFKQLIAYSSLSHVNFILVGLFVWRQSAHTGAILQALNHGITITALFLVAFWLEERLKSRQLHQIKGLAAPFPLLCWVTFFFALAAIALPGTNNFIGEFFILFGLFTSQPYLAALLALSLVFSVLYMLRWMQAMYFGKNTLAPPQHDLNLKELAFALPLAVAILWIGIYPAPVLKQVQSATEEVLSIPP